MKNSKYKRIRKGQKSIFFTKPMSDEEKFGTNSFKAIIYVRVSGDGQVRDGHGLESQEMICREWCKKQEGSTVEVVKVFREEGISGSIVNRKSMEEAIKFLEKENNTYTKIHYFIVTDADRISRPESDISEALLLENRIESNGVKIVIVNSNRNTDTDEGKLMQNIQYAIAGYERKKIRRRNMDGKLNSLKKGGRPFASPPTGYKRNRLGNKKYIDEIDSVKGPIIKEGLELYAYNKGFTKTQLHEFRKEQGLTTSSSSKRLYFTFIEKTFQEHRLYFYAGYVYYPYRGVDTPVQGNQKGLIKLDVIEKILEKENNTNKTKKSKGRSLSKKKSIQHPLHGLITCNGCSRKLGCYKSKGNGGEYRYYACTNKYCKERANISKGQIEKEFEELIKTMKIPKSIFKLLRKIVVSKRERRKKELKNSIPALQGALVSINKKMGKIEEKILKITNEKLIQKLEEERSSLEITKEEITKKIENKKNDDDSIEDTLKNIEPIFTDPVTMRKKSNYEIRELLFMVRFGGILYHKKNLGLRTNETTGLYYYFSTLGEVNPIIYLERESNPHILADTRFGV